MSMRSGVVGYLMVVLAMAMDDGIGTSSPVRLSRNICGPCLEWKQKQVLNSTHLIWDVRASYNERLDEMKQGMSTLPAHQAKERLPVGDEHGSRSEPLLTRSRDRIPWVLETLNMR